MIARIPSSQDRVLARSSRLYDARPTGFSLVELMVGLTISLIGTFAMMQAFSLFEGQKRTTTSGNDAQQSGSYSMYELERQVRTGGSGIVQGKSAAYNIWACNMSGSNLPNLSVTTLPDPFASVTKARAIPALIYSGGEVGGKALPDIISVVSGNPAARVFGAPISTAPAATANGVVMADTAFGMYTGEYTLASDGSGNCVLRKISAVVDITKAITFVADPAGSPAAMTTRTYLFDLGKAPVLSLFGVNTTDNTLVSYDLLGRNGAGSTEMADGIVLLKAVYGVDDGSGGGVVNDGIVDSWVGATGGWSASTLNDGTPASAVKIGQIRAIRAAVVSRSQLPERTSDYNGSSVTLTLFQDLSDTSLHYVVDTDPEYRYKVYTTTIPLHNAAIKKIF